MPRVFVGGLSADVRASELAARFASFGKVNEVVLARGKTPETGNCECLLVLVLAVLFVGAGWCWC